MNLSYGDQTLWPVYITIENLDAKTWQSQKRLRILFLGSITIVYQRSEDANNKKKKFEGKD